MKKSNQLITIASTELVATDKAAAEINAHLTKIRRKFRLQKSARKDLEAALRDVLLEKLAKPTSVVTLKDAQAAIKIVGEDFDDGSVKDAARKSSVSVVQKIQSFIKSSILTEQNRKNALHALAGFFLLGIGMQLYILRLFATDSGNNQQFVSSIRSQTKHHGFSRG